MSRRAVLLLMTLLTLGALLPATRVGLVNAATYVAPSCTLQAPPPGQASPPCMWQGVTLHSPNNDSLIAGPPTGSSPTPCSPDTVGDCEDTKITVPPGVSPATMYIKVQWQHPAWQAFMYVVDPSGNLKGQGAEGCDQSSYEKGCGNQTTLPFDELAVIDPAPGTWTVRVAAVNIHNEAYTGEVALTHSNPLEYAAENLDQLTSHLTRTQRVNVVFANGSVAPSFERT